jgi:2-polyprenyl-3-methyl-5-hydroxy-6-metoxy-1,4-benzoquinol methylase
MSEQAHWEDRYIQGNTPWETGHTSTELQRFLATEKIPACRAIDLGCGLGANAIWLAQQGFDVAGVDFSPSAIAGARQRAATAGVAVAFQQADVLDPPDLGLPFHFFFDRGCYHVLRRIDQAHRYVEVMARLTAPGACGLVLTGNAREKQEPGPPVVTEQEIRADWETKFDVIWLREFRFDQNLMDTSRPLAWSVFLRRKS